MWRRKVAGFFRWLAPIAEELVKDYVRAEIGREFSKARNRGELRHPGEELTGQLPSQHER